MIDHRDSHAVGMRLRHDAGDLGIDRRASRDRYKVAADNIFIFMHTSTFNNAPSYSNGASAQFSETTSDTGEVVALAMRLGERLWKDGFQYSKCGVMITELPPETIRQPALWGEKATLLHAAANSNKPVERLSRHYYDISRLYRLMGGMICEDHSLLAEVVRHKKVFFRSASANYETAVPGTLRLVPGKELEAHLRKDWREMQEMLFGVAPTFDDVLKDVQEVEDLINSSERNSQQTSGGKEKN